MRLRKDKYTGVLFDADDPKQLAEHPHHVPTSNAASERKVDYSKNPTGAVEKKHGQLD